MKYRSKVTGYIFEGIDVYNYTEQSYSIGMRETDTLLNGSLPPFFKVTTEQFMQLFERVEDDL